MTRTRRATPLMESARPVMATARSMETRTAPRATTPVTVAAGLARAWSTSPGRFEAAGATGRSAGTGAGAMRLVSAS
ncbi:hypothetical protein RB196_18105 [Streptomyces sp. PmtA]|uniref:hypothetical protein n=1 Tax=Streptomyces sp. PmtA TaxID=3074275 RepID=UPI00301582C5